MVAIPVREIVSNVRRAAGKAQARDVLRRVQVLQRREESGEHAIAARLIGQHVAAHGTAGTWVGEQWRSLGVAFTAAGLRWQWSAVVVEVSMVSGSVDRDVFASFAAAGLSTSGIAEG